MSGNNGKPKRDGSGDGARANEGRGGCSPVRSDGQGIIINFPRGRNKK